MFLGAPMSPVKAQPLNPVPGVNGITPPADSRVAQNGDMNWFPANAAAQIWWVWPDNSMSVCSGYVFKSPAFGHPSLQIATAGHCVYWNHTFVPNNHPEGWIGDNATGYVAIGRNVDSKPYGTCTVDAWGTFNGFKDNDNLEFDLEVFGRRSRCS
jgi:hypothetical protein